MSRDFEMLIFGDARGLPLILFPTSFGRYSHNKDFGLIDACAPFVDSGKITIYWPDSADQSCRLTACGHATPLSG